MPFYTKYCPINFDEFVGNFFMRSFLKVFIANNQANLISLISEDSLGFIISGPEKSGRHTVARIFLETAKAELNKDAILVFDRGKIPPAKMADVVIEMHYPSIDDGTAFLAGVCQKEDIFIDTTVLKRVFRFSNQMVGESLKLLEGLAVACDGRIEKKHKLCSYLFIYDDVLRMLGEGDFNGCLVSVLGVVENFKDFNLFLSILSGVVGDLLLKDLSSGGNQKQFLNSIVACIYHFRSINMFGDFTDSANLFFNFIAKNVFSGNQIQTGSKLLSGNEIIDFLTK